MLHSPRFVAIICCAFSWLMLSQLSLAGSPSLVISEIGAFEKAGSDALEWIEIYNRSSASIDITGWKFFDSSGSSQIKHTINIPDGVSASIAPEAYAIIALNDVKFKEKYTDVSVQIFDSSWGTLNESGELIGLIDPDGVTQEQFTYIPATEHSLERSDLTLDDYTSSNWKEHASSHTAGLTNSNKAVPPADDSDTGGTDTATSTPETDTSPTDTQDTTEPSGSSAVVGWGTLRINELVSDPTEYDTEWIEIINLTNSTIDLSGWILYDGSNKRTTLSGSIGPNGFQVFDKLKFKMNNSGDIVTLADTFGFTVDRIAYGSWDDGSKSNNAPKAKKPMSLARVYDGISTNNDANDFAITVTPTRGFANRIFVPPPPPPTQEPTKSNKKQEVETETEKEEDIPDPNYDIVINELLPNVKGPDTYDEFIELYNTSGETINLSGWKLTDKTSISYTFGKKKGSRKTIKPNEYLVLKRRTTKLILNNKKSESLTLIDKYDRVIDKIQYDPPAREDISLSREEEGWLWTKTLTPGKENIINIPNEPPSISLETPEDAFQGEEIFLDASDTYDANNDDLFFTWSFGDRSKRIGPTREAPSITHTYKKGGTFNVRLAVSDGTSTSTKRAQIVVLAGSNQIEEEIEKEKPTTKRKSSKKRGRPLYSVDLKEVRDLDIGDRVRTTGTVSVKPGVLGSQIFYLSGSGMQIYMHKKNFPDINVGDTIQVIGEISEAGGERRIKIKNKSDIVIIKEGKTPDPLPAGSLDVSEDTEGTLIKISGEVIEVGRNQFYIDDDNGEVKVVIKKSTNISSKVRPGDLVNVIGIVSQTRSGYRLLPRDNKDIEVTGHIDLATFAAPSSKSTAQAFKDTYLPATAGGVTSILIALIWRQRAVILGSAVVGAILRRKKEDEIKKGDP